MAKKPCPPKEPEPWPKHLPKPEIAKMTDIARAIEEAAKRIKRK